jgi:hypothetical protein
MMPQEKELRPSLDENIRDHPRNQVHITNNGWVSVFKDCKEVVFGVGFFRFNQMGYTMNRLHFAFCLLMCAGLAVLLGFSSVQGAELGKVDLPGLKRAAKNASASVSAPARVALGAYYRGQKKYTEAAKWTADSAALAETNLEWPRVLVFAEHARIRAAAGVPGEALELLGAKGRVNTDAAWPLRFDFIAQKAHFVQSFFSLWSNIGSPIFTRARPLVAAVTCFL